MSALVHPSCLATSSVNMLFTLRYIYHYQNGERGRAAFEVAYLLIPACFMIGCGSRVILETI